MRFITQFELEYPYTLFDMENLKFTLQEGLGNKIADSFNWNEIGTTVSKGPVKYKAFIEIEAFPMDKWMEFKSKLLEHFCVYPGSTTKMLEFIKELESFGKPAVAEKQQKEENK
jgi:hypothetical protein